MEGNGHHLASCQHFFHLPGFSKQLIAVLIAEVEGRLTICIGFLLILVNCCLNALKSIDTARPEFASTLSRVKDRPAGAIITLHMQSKACRWEVKLITAERD